MSFVRALRPHLNKRFQQGSESDLATVFELVDALTSSAQAVVHMLCESIYLRLSTIPDKHKKPISNTTL